jgi:hypothetical protein
LTTDEDVPPIGEPSREELDRLRHSMRLTRQKIADIYSVDLTTVRRWIRRLKVSRRRISPKAYNKGMPNISNSGAIIASVGGGLNTLERAKFILGDRLTEVTGRGYLLDGVPAHVDRIVSAAGLPL